MKRCTRRGEAKSESEFNGARSSRKGEAARRKQECPLKAEDWALEAQESDQEMPGTFDIEDVNLGAGRPNLNGNRGSNY